MKSMVPHHDLPYKVYGLRMCDDITVDTGKRSTMIKGF